MLSPASSPPCRRLLAAILLSISVWLVVFNNSGQAQDSDEKEKALAARLAARIQAWHQGAADNGETLKLIYFLLRQSLLRLTPHAVSIVSQRSACQTKRLKNPANECLQLCETPVMNLQPQEIYESLFRLHRPAYEKKGLFMIYRLH